MRRRLTVTLLVSLTASTLLAQGMPRMLLVAVARDPEERPLSGFRFAYDGVATERTSEAGATELELPLGHPPGTKIKLVLLSTPTPDEDWFLVNPMVNVPVPAASAEVVLMRRSTFRHLAAEARDAAGRHPGEREPSPEQMKQSARDVAARYGLTAEELDTAIRSFGETGNLKDQGIAAYLEGRLAEAERLLGEAAEQREDDLAETLLYLGAAQYENGRYREAVATFRKAVALQGDDAVLLGWLGAALDQVANWTEAEPLMRRALALDEAAYGPEHPRVAIRLGNLARLLQETNRASEAEPLMRRALAIDEAAYGTDHPSVAIRLDNLATLLQETNRFAEAEPLTRRALEIHEAAHGPEHPDVATNLGNLASLLHRTDRFAEAEPLMRRALEIDEAAYGPEHPRIATDLSNLAQLLQETDRPAEAEALMRRALEIDEAAYGPEHPDVAVHLNNLAALLHGTQRSAEAEPLMRRALAIDEAAYGPEHPRVAIDLNNLAALLLETNRSSEAEPLMRRQVLIFVGFTRRQGHPHPHLEAAFLNYAALLIAQGKTDAEIDAAIAELVRGIGER